MKVVCEHCGLPFAVARVTPGRAVYCCSGCALAARVPVDANGQFPVNAALGTALGAAFVFFNQGLFWLLALLLAREAGGAVNAGRFVIASLVTGIVVWLTLAFFQARESARRAVDWFVMLATLAGLGWALATTRPGAALFANAIFAAWAMRGLAKGKSAQKK